MLKPVLAGVCLSIAALTATSAHARELSGPQITGLVAGATVEIDTPSGTKIPVRYTAEGRVSADARDLGWYLGQQRDTGRWWVADGQLCHKWLRWFGGEPQCMKINREGHAFRWLARDGSTGTATIAVPPPSVQAAASALPAFGSAFTKRSAEPRAAAVTPPPPRLGLPPRRDADDAGAAADTEPAAEDTAVQTTPVGAAAAEPAPPASAAIAQPSAPIAEAPPTAQPFIVAAIVPPQPKLVDRSSLSKNPPATAPPPAASAASPPAAVAEPPKHAEPKAQPEHPLFKVANVRHDDVLNVRSGPSADHDIVGMIAPGSRGIAITSACRSQWCPVRIDGTAGWVNSAYLTPEVVAAALSTRTEPAPSAALRDSPEAPRACLTPAARALLGRIEQTFGPVQVISTCRSGAVIAGTSRRSRHASGNAIDFKAGPRKAAILAWLIEHHRTGGLMTYPGMDHIHVDIGPRFISLAGGRHSSSWRRGRSE